MKKAIFVNLSQAENFIKKSMGPEDEGQSAGTMEFSNFLNIFVKGIVKEIICNVANIVRNFYR